MSTGISTPDICYYVVFGLLMAIFIVNRLMSRELINFKKES